ncbi:MAG TPA: hypothetical protein VEX18_03015, partial [Polyangiaceae bacterium]|nr:hypothetical protein [Polyangiaceae bacterium]
MSLALLVGCGGTPATALPPPAPPQPTPPRPVATASAATGGSPVFTSSTSTGPEHSAEGAPAPPAAAELPVGSKVLQVGDSFADALGVELGKRLKAAGVRSSLEFRTPSYVPTWASGPELPKLLARYNPDLVLITLGGNELEIPDPEG